MRTFNNIYSVRAAIRAAIRARYSAYRRLLDRKIGTTNEVAKRAERHGTDIPGASERQHAS